MSESDAGFSLLEMAVALALTLAMTTTVVSLLQSATRGSGTQQEVADIEQRLRVAVDTLTEELMAAGAGTYLPGHAGPLNGAFAPVMPFRRGMVAADPPATFRTDTITLIEVPTTAAQTTLVADFVPGSLTMQVAALPGCPAGVNVCGFASGTTVLAFDAGGGFQAFTIAAVVDSASQLTTTRSPPRIFSAGTPIVEARMRTYYLKVDRSAQTSQLMQYDGTANADLPVLDHVVGLAFDYYAAPMFSGTFARLDAAELTDGPWRPDAASADRWDADLLRIRAVGVTIRLEAALVALRGPAGALFANGGTAVDAGRWIPDQEMHFLVAPRNLNLSP
jgi:hypothetical protein